MNNFQKKKSWKHFLQSRPVLIVLSIVVLVFAWNVVVFWGKMADTSRNRKIAEAKISELKDQKAKLSSDITELKTDQGVEEVIRDKFGLVKEGEGMIVVVEDKNNVETAPKSSSFWSFWKNLFQ